jgi:excisionase family DNA binding protein
MTDDPDPDPRRDRLMTADEVAAWLRIPRSTVYQLTRSRRIPYLKVGRRVLFDHGSVAAWVESRTIPPRG